jgi:hypothetical protein
MKIFMKHDPNIVAKLDAYPDLQCKFIEKLLAKERAERNSPVGNQLKLLYV